MLPSLIGRQWLNNELVQTATLCGESAALYIFEEGTVFADCPVGQFVVEGESGPSSLQIIQN